MSKIFLATLFALVLPLVSAVAAEPLAEKNPQLLSLQELRAKYNDPASRYTKVNGIEVHYKDEGKGPAILMIHGSSSSLKTYDVIVAKLKDRYRIIRFDVPSQGLSGLVSNEQAKSMGSTDIPEKLLADLGVKSTACVGVSSGSTMCVYLAAKNPGLVNHLILSNGPADPVENAPQRPPSAAMVAAQKESQTAGYKTRSYWTAFFSRQAGVPEHITPAIIEMYYDYNRRPQNDNVIALASKVADHEMALDLMAKVTAPVLLLWGAKDGMLPIPAADVLGKYLKNAEVSKLVLPDAGHYPPLEIPERYAQIVAAYLEAVSPVAPQSPSK
ncbi:MAG: alpha/beta hydrolase [Rhodospirillaceae bacterium]|nr:alpha/beta hydrolase [Rhodospirillaceae bacterium]